MSDIFSAHKRENSPVPPPSSHALPKVAVETLEQRVARGDHTALVATLQACVTSMEAWCKTVSGLPNADPKTSTGAALLVFKKTVLPKMEALATEAKTRLPKQI